MELIDIIPEFNLYEEYWKIYTKSDIIPPQYVAADAVIDRSIIGEGTEVHGTITNSVIGAGVTIEPGAEVHDSIIMRDCHIKAGAKINKPLSLRTLRWAKAQSWVSASTHRANMTRRYTSLTW